jgi:hypothetical protein
LPAYAPPEYADRATLWNAVEMGERNKNAQLAREIEVALPAELTPVQNRFLVRNYCQQQFVDKGMCADICMHDKKDGNPHAHIMLTVRPLERDGAWGAKSRKEYVLDKHGERVKLKNGAYKTYKVSTVDWNEPTKAEGWRAAWTEAVNTTLEKYGFDKRIDHRSFERQGKEEIPTVHLGVSTSQMERKGVSTNRGEINREARRFNASLKKLQSRIDELKNWLKTETKKDDPTNLVHIVQRVLVRIEERRKASPYPTRDDSDIFVEILDFLNEHDIENMVDFKEKYFGLTRGSDKEKFVQMQLRLDYLLREERRMEQKEQQEQHKPRARGMER